MTLSKQEILFLREHKEIIKGILEKRQKDIISAAIDSKDEKQKIKLLDLAEQFKEGLTIIENLSKLKKKQENKNTGI